jgi:hypothetical protein
MPPNHNETPPRQIVAERVTIGLVPKTAAELQQVVEMTGLSKTDIVNKAISLYAFVETGTRDGYEMLRRNRDTGELELIRFL